MGHSEGDMEVMARHHLELARFEPALGLLGVGYCRSGRRRPDGHNDRSTRDSGATADNVVDRAAMPLRHDRVMSRSVERCAAAGGPPCCCVAVHIDKSLSIKFNTTGL